MDILIYIILWIVFSFIVGSLGKNKNIGFGYAFIISLLFSPLIGLIFVLFSANKTNLTDLKIAHEAGVINDDEYKKKIRKVIPTQQDKEDTKKGYIVVGVIILIAIIIWQIVKLF